ncbi:energy transducer TonB [Belliella sp. R4-6]|uniref:Energy transducer TonB n=1 Tax=Belliella alkalica TaxID=1730871 RepID=A0ABS9VAZ4_9BACT|nr:energy transducer TonB [Belliella alkalica]MCH7413048.1 energy transducer TonB [Belliella alkalica]
MKTLKMIKISIFFLLYGLIFGACLSSSDLLSKKELKAQGYIEIPNPDMQKLDKKDRVDSQPMYIDGLQGIYKDLSKGLVYPSTERSLGIQGTVLLSFVVNEKGELEDIEVLKSVSRNIDNESIRVIKTLDKWYPAIKNKKFVKIRLKQPIKFALT